VTYLQLKMLDELQRRNYSQSTVPTTNIFDCSNTTGSSSRARFGNLLAWRIQPLPLRIRLEGMGERFTLHI
jgi:hypothetical protein